MFQLLLQQIARPDCPPCLCDSGNEAEALVLAIFCLYGTGRAILGAMEGGFGNIESQSALDWKGTFGLLGGKGRRSARVKVFQMEEQQLYQETSTEAAQSLSGKGRAGYLS